MLERIELTNFRCWKSLQLDLKPITLIFGANSTGKTALLHALLMLKQTAESNDRGRSLCFDGYADLGTFSNLVHGHRTELPLGVKLKWRPRTSVTLREPRGKERVSRVLAETIVYDAQWCLDDDISLTHLSYEVPDQGAFELERRDDGRYEPHVTFPKSMAKRRVGRAWPLSQPESCYALPRDVARDWPRSDFLEFNHQFELLMERIRYLGPLRDRPQRTYLWTGEAPSVIQQDGQRAVDALLSAQRAAGHGRSSGRRTSGRTLVGATETWLARFGLASRFAVNAIDKERRYYEIQVGVPQANTEAALPDVGFGVSQVLPVIVQLLFAPEHSILLFEQPEIHLHPSAAALLADLFLEVAEERKLQLIIETHSEYLLTRLQRRIAEARADGSHAQGESHYASPEGIAMYFCRLGQNGAEATKLEVNLFGEIENWPDGFFGNAIGDLDAMTKAIVRSKSRGNV